ncbi:MAG: PspC domain-containing protein [Aestuariibacter sp.]|nr:PspC domain-containing protein [Aestuariibacter sp.]
MTNRLERKNGKIFGVAAGLADYFDIDVTIMRIILIIFFMIDGCGVTLVTYLIAAAIMPKAWDYDGGGSGQSSKEKEFSNA